MDNTGEDSSSEDNEPLAKLQEQHRNNEKEEYEPLSYLQDKIRREDLEKPIARRKKTRHVKRKIFISKENSGSESGDSDDSVKDPTFTLKKKDLVESDEEFETDGRQTVRKFKTLLGKIKSRNHAWLMKPTTLSNRKKNTPGRPTYNANQFKKCKTPAKILTNNNSTVLAEAKRRSLSTYRAKVLVQKFHFEKLDNLLTSNGLRRIPMKGDGNCFFHALHSSLPSYGSHAEIRKMLVEHMDEHSYLYMDFLPIQGTRAEDRLAAYHRQLKKLAGDGHWSSDLADALPLAAANALQREITIFSSNRFRPVLKIQLTIGEPTKSPLFLAQMCSIGYEHYDACQTSNAMSPQAGTSSENQTRNITNCEEVDNPYHQKACTPRKQAQYVSPKRRLKTRKQKSRPDLWKRNIRKKLKMSGKEYVSCKGTSIRGRRLSYKDCSKCRFKCNENITEDQRKEIFEGYWHLQDTLRHRDFICNNVIEKKPKRMLIDAKRPRTSSREFTFTVNGKRIRVCKGFFLKTLDVGDKVVHYALKSKDENNCASNDKRGRHSPANKTPEASLDFLKQHIESFPVLDPHYTRKDTKRKFLGSELNITKMYAFYKDECIKTQRKPVGAAKYRKTFCEDYNYSFHIPKKDQCRICTLYLQKEESGALTDELKTEYHDHIEKKNRARQEKQFDKDFAKSHADYHTVTFDLQAVLNTPCSSVSQVYYKRKMNSYNLCIYSLEDGKASSFLWNETAGKRGSNEIASCLFLYLKSLPPTIRQVCFFSDCCSGQNRNRNVALALLNAVSTLDNIEVIDQKYLEPGHTEMECDSMHAAIETAKKRTSIYVPSQWDTIIRMARKRVPYTVIPLKHPDFRNYKSVANKCLLASITDKKGKKVKWMSMKWIQFRKREQNAIFFKYGYDEEEFNCLHLRSSSRKSQFHHSASIPHCYTNKLPISSAKKKDLVSLCDDGTIPEEYHPYYKNMLCCANLQDKIPEPDLLDEVEDTDEEI